MKQFFFHRLLGLFTLLSFVIFNSNVYIYKHLCGDELYSVSLYSVTTCGCEDEVSINSTKTISTTDDGCCKETIIYAHNDNTFIGYDFIHLFWVVLIIQIFHTNRLHLTATLKDFFITNFFHKWRSKHITLYQHNLLVRSVVLRN